MRKLGKAFTTFWRDYNDMCVEPQSNWLKLHWKGYILMLIGSYATGYGIGWTIDKIAEAKHKKEYEELYKTYEIEE